MRPDDDEWLTGLVGIMGILVAISLLSSGCSMYVESEPVSGGGCNTCQTPHSHVTPATAAPANTSQVAAEDNTLEQQCLSHPDGDSWRDALDGDLFTYDDGGVLKACSNGVGGTVEL